MCLGTIEIRSVHCCRFKRKKKGTIEIKNSFLVIVNYDVAKGGGGMTMTMGNFYFDFTELLETTAF